MPDLDRRRELSLPPQFGQVSPSCGRAQVGESRLEVAPGFDAAQMPAVAVGAGDELTLAQRLVGDDPPLEADRPERAAARAEGLADLVLGRRPRPHAERGIELRGLDAVVAADEREHDARRPS